MKVTENGGPAFPAVGIPRHSDYDNSAGMSLRDYFAIHAPAPKETEINACYDADRMRNPHNDSYKPRIRSRYEIETELRYRYADAMIEAREKEFK